MNPVSVFLTDISIVGHPTSNPYRMGILKFRILYFYKCSIRFSFSRWSEGFLSSIIYQKFSLFCPFFWIVVSLVGRPTFLLYLVDRMLNFKHIPFVHSAFLHHLFSEIPSFRPLRRDFSDSFEDWLRISGGACGVLTLSFDSGSSLEEVAAVGYQDDGFFYSFLARSTGNLDRLNRDFFPLWFPAEDHDLFHPD
ncbi:hypothetical protein CH375_10335, partial [Leptospira ellisii]